MTAPDPTESGPSLLGVTPQEKAVRSASFGGVASLYERYRPGPPVAAVDWLLPTHVGRVVDLGAGTGALTRLLVDRADEVVAVEPDDRMLAVLVDEVPGVRAIEGRGESMPVPAGCADAVLASSSWHWMDPVATLHEVARVLVLGGILGAVWSGPDPDGPFLAQARSLLSERSQGAKASGAEEAGRDAGRGEFAGFMTSDALRPQFSLEIPPGVPFDQPERNVFTWDVALDADELIGLLGTLSWVITMAENRRAHLFAEARRLLRDYLGVEGPVTVDVAFRGDAWRTRRN